MYYFLRQDLFSETGTLEITGHTEATGTFLWTAGVRFDRPVPNEMLLLDSRYGSKLPDFFDTTIPVMSSRMIDGLRSEGASNIDAYPMTLRNSGTEETIEGYSAVNIVGCVDAVDLSKSGHRLRFGEPYFTSGIVIDPDKIAGLSVFRLLHGPGLIVVDERMAGCVRGMGLANVILQATETYEGA